jgi:hypothetical protein
MLPNCIGIGAPKAGTTWLFKCLAEHPEVFMAACKETNFFDYGQIAGRLGEYEAHFGGADGAKAVGEISTRYLGSARAPGRIRTMIPGVRLFVALRNPIDQVYSHYWHLRRQNFHEWSVDELPSSFEEALGRYEARLLAPACYSTHLERWLRHFDRSQMLVIFYDAIQSDPKGVLKTLYSHLGVDTDFTPPSMTDRGSDVRRGVSPKSPRHAEIHSRVYGFLSREVYYRLKQVLGPRRAQRIKEAFRVRQVMERVFFREGYPQLSAATRTSVRKRFSSDIASLEALTGVSLDHWR